MKKNLEEYKIR